MPIMDRVKSAWNAFRNNALDVNSPEVGGSYMYSGASSPSPSRPRRLYNDRTIVTSIYNRISIDVAGVVIRHILLDEQGRYQKDATSSLNNCLTLEANLDQAPQAFRQDIVMTLFDRGVAAIVPVDTAVNPQTNEVFDIFTLRVGEIIGWHPKHVRLRLYNEETAQRQEITLEKRLVAIVENPLYTVINEPSSVLQRLIRKLALLDAVDEQSSSGKLDLIIQLPYVIKSEARREQAEKRRQDIEFQLKGSQYGIAYTDGTEKITQLNRPTENNLMAQVEWLTTMVYGQLGITDTVMNGTADEATMTNYWHRTIKPLSEAIVEAMQRSFIGAAKPSERIAYFRNPFAFVNAKDLAEVVDKFTRNEVLSANEIRGYMGIPPSTDPKADQLVNSNLKAADTRMPGQAPPTDQDTQPPA